MILIGTIISTIIGAAILALVSAFWFRRRLCGVARYFTYSKLSDSGKTVEITILNRGVRPEEDIELQLDPARRYTLLASSDPNLTIDDNLLKVKRIPEGNNVEAILLVEQGDFGNANIIALISKEAKGKIVNKLEEAPLSPTAVPIVIIILLIFFAAPIYVGYYAITSGGHPELLLDGISGNTAHRAHALEESGWQNATRFADSLLGQQYGLGEFPVIIKYEGRKADLVKYEITLDNKTSEWLTVYVKLSTTAQKNLCDNNADDILSDIVVPAKTTMRREMSAYLPATIQPQAVRIEVHLSTSADELYGIWRMLDAN